jgi:pilus assembly protein Flp/PilA
VKKFIKLLKDISGASAAEYALILAIVGAALAVAAVALGNSIAGAMDNTTALINTPPTN